MVSGSRNGADRSAGADTPATAAASPHPELAPADWTTADEIRRRNFGVVERGFDPQEVRDYLAKIADWFSDLHVQLSRLRKSQSHDYSVPTPSPAGPPPEEAHALAARMADLLRDAEEHAAKVRTEAEEQVRDMEERARTMVVEAEERASRAVTEAEARAQRVRSESGGIAARAKAEAEERLAAAEAARAGVLAELKSLHEQLADAVGRLESAGPGASSPMSPVPEGPAAGPDAEAPEADAIPTNGDHPQPRVTIVPDRSDPAETAAAASVEVVPPGPQ